MTVALRAEQRLLARPRRRRGPARRCRRTAARACRAAATAEKPGRSVGTRNADTPRAPGPPAARHHEGDAGDGPVGDEDLAAGDPPPRGGALGGRPQVGRVGAVVGLGQPEAAEDLAGGHPRQPLLLLLLAAPALHRAGDQAEVHRHDRADVGVAAPELLDEQAVGQRVGAAAAVGLVDGHADEPGLPQPVERLLREALLAVVAQGSGTTTSSTHSRTAARTARWSSLRVSSTRRSSRPAGQVAQPPAWAARSAACCSCVRAAGGARQQRLGGAHGAGSARPAARPPGRGPPGRAPRDVRRRWPARSATASSASTQRPVAQISSARA